MVAFFFFLLWLIHGSFSDFLLTLFWIVPLCIMHLFLWLLLRLFLILFFNLKNNFDSFFLFVLDSLLHKLSLSSGQVEATL